MKKQSILLLLALGLSLTAVSQNKLLTIQEAVLKGRSSLAPKKLQNLGFIGEGKKMVYMDNNQLYTVSEDGKSTVLVNKSDMNKTLVANSYDRISAFEGLRWKTRTNFVYE